MTTYRGLFVRRVGQRETSSLGTFRLNLTARTGVIMNDFNVIIFASHFICFTEHCLNY